jgi:DNA-directed RNA polymerase specialized sigma24 family protein
MLLEEIAPRLRSTIPKVVRPVGAEDAEELVQDALVTAAQLLDAVERNGKTVTAGNIAYYTILHMKSGRRGSSSGRTDALASTTQLDARSSVLSLEEELGYDPETDEAITLGDLLACEREDPALAAARDIDWDLFLATHDYRYGVIVQGLLEGKNFGETACECGAGFARIYQLKAKLAEDLLAFMGSQAIADSVRIPAWRAHLVAEREHVACRADRRRQ